VIRAPNSTQLNSIESVDGALGAVAVTTPST